MVPGLLAFLLRVFGNLGFLADHRPVLLVAKWERRMNFRRVDGLLFWEHQVNANVWYIFTTRCEPRIWSTVQAWISEFLVSRTRIRFCLNYEGFDVKICLFDLISYHIIRLNRLLKLLVILEMNINCSFRLMPKAFGRCIKLFNSRWLSWYLYILTYNITNLLFTCGLCRYPLHIIIFLLWSVKILNVCSWTVLSRNQLIL